MKKIILAIVIILFCFSCSKQKGEINKFKWLLAKPSSVNVDEIILNEFHEYIKKNSDYKVDSFLIIKDGKLIYENYYNQYGKDDAHQVFSVTKSFTAHMIGKLYEEKRLDLNDPITKHIKGYKYNKDYEKISIEDALTMRGGIDWVEGRYDQNDDTMKAGYSTDAHRYNLNKQLIEKPGTRFVYSGAMSDSLGKIVEDITGENIKKYLEKILFKELGINKYSWRHRGGFATGSYGLMLRPRDMAKFGLLYLNNGVWNGKQMISADWIKKSTKTYSQLNNNLGYGYQWWTQTIRVGNKDIYTYMAMGFGDQKIIVIPELKMVLVMTSSDYVNRNYGKMDKFMSEYILPSMGIKNAKYIE